MSALTNIHPHLAHLPVYRGLPVAWAAVWSAEKALPIQWRPTTTGIVGGLHTSRRFGMTWIDVGTSYMGQGVPDFGSTSSGRQRRCMLLPRCQVCGRRIEGVPWWILPNAVEDMVPFGGHPPTDVWTKQPPLCQMCSDLAPLWCPALRHMGYDVVQAVGTPVAAIGDVPMPDGTVQPKVGSLLTDPMRVFMVGREVVVRLDFVQGTYRQVDP